MDDLFIPDDTLPSSSSANRDSGIGIVESELSPLQVAINECKRQVQLYENDLENLRQAKVQMFISRNLIINKNPFTFQT